MVALTYLLLGKGTLDLPLKVLKEVGPALGLLSFHEATTKSGESWADLNKRRGRLSAIARKQFAELDLQIKREERAKKVAANGGAADVRTDRALGARFHIHIARTVLSALREPTLGMVEAGRTQIDDAGKWRAMVDVALRELDGTY